MKDLYPLTRPLPRKGYDLSTSIPMIRSVEVDRLRWEGPLRMRKNTAFSSTSFPLSQKEPPFSKMVATTSKGKVMYPPKNMVKPMNI